MFSNQMMKLAIRIHIQMDWTVNHGHRRAVSTTTTVFLPFQCWGDTGFDGWRRQDGWVIHVAMVGKLETRHNVGGLAFNLGPFHVAVGMINAVDRLRIWGRGVTEVG